MDASEDFEDFVLDARVRLRRALIGAVGFDRVDDAVGEALAWAYENRQQLETMENPVGYLYRVGQSKVRRPRSVQRRLQLLRVEPVTIPDVEPGLVIALAALPESQRISVWLAHGCSWSHAEIAEALDVGTSTVATHVRRGLNSLRDQMGVES